MVINGGTWPSVGRNARRPQGLVTYLRASTPHLPNSLPLLHFFTPVAQLLYQEYSDVFLNKEIQSQQRLDSLTEAPGPISPRQPRKALVSSESYLHRLSMASSGSLWQEIPVVRNSTVLLSMTHEDQKLQEVPPGGVGQGLRKGKRGLLCSRLSPTQHPHPHHHRERAVPTTLTTTTPGHPQLAGFKLLCEHHHSPSYLPPPRSINHSLLRAIGLSSCKVTVPLNLMGGVYTQSH